MILLEKMRTVINELNEDIAEREESIECTAIGLLTKKNVFKLGDTGQAKSFEITEFCKRITGAKKFERLLSKQTDEAALFGHLDLKSLIDGNPKMITTGKIPDSHIVFLDEIFKCNDSTLNCLLTALNERKFTNESETVDIPVISFMSASNEIPDFSDPHEKILRPLYDRFELKVITNYIQNRDTRLRILSRKQNAQRRQSTAFITLDELYAMQSEVTAVTVPEQINELMDDILCELRGLGIHVSDRKFLNYYPIAKAKAWLNGRDIVQNTDLSVMKYYLWTKPEEIPVIQKVLDKFCLSPLHEELKTIISLADESSKDFDANVNTNPTGAMIKLRGELVRIYRMLMKAENDVTDKEDKTAVTIAIEDLEDISRDAHKKTNFTYAPLSELQKLL